MGQITAHDWNWAKNRPKKYHTNDKTIHDSALAPTEKALTVNNPIIITYLQVHSGFKLRSFCYVLASFIHIVMGKFRFQYFTKG